MNSSGRLDRTIIRGGELFWQGHQSWLAECGYMLRPRYQSNWQPSWAGTRKDPLACEDGQLPVSTQAMDATRLSDGAFVMLKIVNKSVNPQEVDIATFLCRREWRSDPTNHCVPIYDVLQVPEQDDLVLLVMPLLKSFDDPRFDTVGEVVDFFRQLFEGLQFMHKHRVAHRDCTDVNIMMDAKALYAKPYHPISVGMKRDFTGPAEPCTRTQARVKYYFIDFGISRQYDPMDSSIALEPPTIGNDSSVPEFQRSMELCNPFPVDVYCLGNMIRQNFLLGSDGSRRAGFEFMRPLIADMVSDVPKQRPKMDTVVARFRTICGNLSSSKLRSRVVKEGDSAAGGMVRSVSHMARRVQYAASGAPPVPRP